MLRHEQRNQPDTISDQELGFAALMLLLVVVVTVVFVPGLV